MGLVRLTARPVCIYDMMFYRETVVQTNGTDYNEKLSYPANCLSYANYMHRETI